MLARMALQAAHPLALVVLEARKVTRLQLALLLAGRCQTQVALEV
jgi:hypothetical protein